MANEGLGKTPQSGSTVEGWTLHDSLGAGGIAAVYRATHHDGRVAAVKVLHPSSVGTDEVRRFVREYKALARIQHPNIVQVFGTGVTNGYPWIAMELVDGIDLDREIARWTTTDPADRWARVEQILRGICAALSHIHERGMVHRDLKPSNILLSSDGTAKLGDFGVVKDSNAHTTALTMHGNLVGTVAFMAPEHIMDEPVDARSDLYSLGAVLYVMITGQRPIQADSVTGFLARHLSHVPTPPSVIRPDVPQPLESICQRLLYKDRNQRFADANAVLLALDDDGDPSLPPMRGQDVLLTDWHGRLAALEEGEGGVVAIVGPTWSGTSFALRSLVSRCPVPVALASGRSRNPITALARALGAAVDEAPATKHLRLLASATRQGPCVLAIDDLDAADPKMVSALARLMRKVVAQEAHPVLLIYAVTAPVDERVATLHEGLVSTLVPTVWQLAPLIRRDVSMLLRDQGLKGAVGGVLARRLHQELGGRGAAVQEQLSALLQQGWLTRTEGRLVATKPPEFFAKAPLPVPGRAQVHLERLMTRLDTESLAIAEVLAVLDRRARSRFVTRVADASVSAGEDLVRAGLAHRDQADEIETIGLSLPWAAAVIRSALSEDRRRSLHLSIAQVLGSSRRRSDAQEVAHHYNAAGEPGLAWPLYLRAARNAARNRDYAGVLAMCDRASATEDAGLHTLDAEGGQGLRLQGLVLRGDAHLARGEWRAAIEPLTMASDLARSRGDQRVLSRALQGLGRAWYRLGRFAEARTPLIEALRASQSGDSDRSPALRALADIRLRENKFQQAEILWNEALSTARAADSVDAEARALRGLAHLRALEGRLESAADALDRADELLRANQTPRVRAAVLARSIELDLAGGRYDRAIARSEALTDLVDRRDLEDRSAEANALFALAMHRVGEGALARRTIDQLEAWCHSAHWTTLLHIARLRAQYGPYERVETLLPAGERLPEDPLEDAAAQAAAIRARSMASERPERAKDLARWCLVRPPPRLILRHVDILLDAGEALLVAGDDNGAREAAKVGLRNLSGPGADGLRLELLSLFHRADKDPRILAAFTQVAGRVCAAQSPKIIAGLRSRPGLKPALG